MRHLPFWWDCAVFVGAIGVLWFWVATVIQALTKRRSVPHFSFIPLRVIFDIGLIIEGGFIGLFFAAAVGVPISILNSRVAVLVGMHKLR